MKKATLLLALACFFVAGYGQYLPGENRVLGSLSGLLEQLKKSSSNTQRATILLNIGYKHLYKPNGEKEDLDTALQYARQVTDLGRQMKSAFFQQEALLLTSMIHTEGRDYTAAQKLFPAMQDSIRLKALMVLTMFNLNLGLSESPPRLWIDSGAYYMQQALKLSYRTRLLPGMMSQIVEQVALFYRNLRLPDLSEKYFFIALKFSDSLGGLSKVRLYSRMCGMYSLENNFYKATQYGILAEKAVNASTTNQDMSNLYLNLANLYASQNKPEGVIRYRGYLLAAPHKYKGFVDLYVTLDRYCDGLRKMGRQDEILPYVQKFQQQCPPETDNDKIFYHSVLAKSYQERKEYGLAETNYLEAIRYAELVHTSIGAMYYNLGVCYYQSKRFEQALVAFKVAEKNGQLETYVYMANTLSYIASCEAALDNHKSAYDYLLRSKTTSDSIFTIAKVKLADELEVQYKTRRKEDTLRTKEENIRTLNYTAEKMRQAALLKDAELEQAALLSQKDKITLTALELKAKNAEVIEKNYTLQQAAIKQAEVKKKITYVVIALLFVIVSLLCWLFLTKLKSNKVITEKNDQLQELVKDKIWLLKEMHHRVKNNLHIIDNLLEFQAAYLQDDARDAIRHSQSRIFSMSLIHQKLYQTEDSKTIDMTSYIPELVDYLQDSFNIHQSVHVNMDIDPTVFNVGEAVPLGLIINEAVTNSMKHAFSEGQPGKIDISLKAKGAHKYDLVVADNGRGLSHDFDFDQASSMGFQLIKGLAQQLQAELHIANTNGLKITVAHIVANLTVGKAEVKPL
ncbi:Two-component sensor histidine kinase, contains HisKA and HATPase domains [Filimonas lacunae]|uniref:histidine kinase n=1 Tax=Filimonas lacunae TaxID=477680 RepID=A0A173MBV2_9BACT|nr:histidine kinase dimerization/phosphoacceptor domain -containing protein [Filimonas lacunae]BAV05042.1 sensor histidine kinase [Filimonas lacunae]SIT33601.1 Two-component sensor histidine kinase, contains HisKA and HATPase domains [Filimonas lacunae]